jgi:hypothetical protein
MGSLPNSIIPEYDLRHRATSASACLASLVIQQMSMQAKLLLVATFVVAALSAQTQPVLGEDTVKVSDHVWAIMGWPNIAIVVDNRAALGWSSG